MGMEWQEWKGKYVFIRTKYGKVYSGTVQDVENTGIITWIVLLDKYKKIVQFADSEITQIKEEEGE
jgi:ribosome maturation factor RimP